MNPFLSPGFSSTRLAIYFSTPKTPIITMDLNLSSSHPLLRFFRSHDNLAPILPAATSLIRRIRLQGEFLDEPSQQDFDLLSDHVSLPGDPLNCHAYLQSTEWKVYFLTNSVPNDKGLGLLIFNQNTSTHCGQRSNFRHSSILSEVHSFVMTDSQARSRRSLIYPEFSTLEDYIDSTGPNHLENLLRDYIIGLYDLHHKGQSHGEITRQTLIVFEDKGMFLQPIPLYGRTRSRTPIEFANLGNALDVIFDKHHWYEVGTRIHNLVQFMRQILTIEHCQWLKYAPFILTNDGIISTFIPSLHDMAKWNATLENKLQSDIPWTFAVAQFGDLNLISEFQTYVPRRSGWRSNYLDLLRFLRNSLAHLNDKVPRVQGIMRGSTRAEYSNLILDASEFVRFIRTIEAGQAAQCDILDTIFYYAAQLTCVLEQVDPNLMP